MIADWIIKHAESSPDKIALRFKDQGEYAEWTYSELASSIRCTAAVLQKDLNITHGDRVAFLGYNSPEFLITFFACARLGAILVPLNWRLAAPEHLYVLQNSGSTLLLLESDFAHLVPVLQEKTAALQMVGLGFTPESGRFYASLITTRQDEINDSDVNVLPVSPAAPVLIVYTSGTTGYPKGAILTHNAVFWNALNNVHLHDMTSNDHVLTVLPLFHVGGLNVLTVPAFYAGATVTLERYFHPDQFFHALTEGQPTLTTLVPAMLDALIHSPYWLKTDCSTLRMISAGSTMVPSHLCEAFRAKGVPVGIIYGATETAPLAIYLRADSDTSKANSVGLAALHCQIRLVDEGGQPVPVGQVGEIVVKGPNIMQGYWGNTEATAQVLRNGWYHTGDMGYCDEEGYYYIADRKKNLIITGGENVYPSEVERVLLEHPGIAALAVIGMPHELLQEIPVAAIVLSPCGLDHNQQALENDWHAFMSDQLAAYKRPQHFFIVDELPRNALGKVQHFRVRQELAQRPEWIIASTSESPPDKNDESHQPRSDVKTVAELQLQLQQAPSDEKQPILLHYLQEQIAQSLSTQTKAV